MLQHHLQLQVNDLSSETVLVLSLGFCSCATQYPPCNSWNEFLPTKLDHAISPLKTLQWFTVTCRTKFNSVVLGCFTGFVSSWHFPCGSSWAVTLDSPFLDHIKFLPIPAAPSALCPSCLECTFFWLLQVRTSLCLGLCTGIIPSERFFQSILCKTPSLHPP